MPRSKRNRVVTLSQTDKHNVGKEAKNSLVQTVRKCIDDHQHIYIFTYDNMRNQKLKDLRTLWGDDSRFFLGRNKIMQIALGRNEAEEYMENLHHMAQVLEGNVGLLFTSKSPKEVEEFFAGYAEEDFARTGNKATEDVVLPKGKSDLFVASQKDQLCKLGIPVELNKGEIHILSNFQVCKKGQVLTPEQAKILEMLDIKQATFKILLIMRWDKKDGALETFRELPDSVQ